MARARYEYSLLIGNLKASTSCLGVKSCPLIGHLDTIKGGGVHAMWAGLGAQSIPCLKYSVQECVRNVVERYDCFMGTTALLEALDQVCSGAAVGVSVSIQSLPC